MLKNASKELQSLVNNGLTSGKIVVRVCPLQLPRKDFYLYLTDTDAKNYNAVVKLCDDRIENKYGFSVPYIIAEVNNTRL